jgi:Pectate lyase superfamily protein
MNMKSIGVIVILALSISICPAQEKRGAIMPWRTYEAEYMHATGIVMGPTYEPYRVETESSGQRCVKLDAKGQFVEFISTIEAKSIVIRYSLPDNVNGNGTKSTLGIYKNGKPIQQHEISSHYSWLYGKYPFTNDPAAGRPRHFYDEIRLTGFKISKGDVIRIQRDDSADDDAGYCIIDLVDLEDPAPPLKPPNNSLSIADKIFLGDQFRDDYTKAFNNCIAKAVETGKTVWIPAGTFKITGDIVLPANVTVQGAGMWYTQLVGDDSLYANANRRIRLKGDGSNIHLADFAIIGKLNYRNDEESNDGIVGSFGTNSTISRIWIEHTKVGMWIQNSMNLKVTGCRMRNTMADGINFCVGMAHSTIENSTARGTGDDCFAIWPTVSQAIKQEYPPGHNLVIHCSGALPYLANGAAIYGGNSNEIKGCSFADISQGSAILVSTTFPTESKDGSTNNNFSGMTIIEDCDIKASGGFDHDWGWRAAVELCLDKRSIAGIEINNINIESSLSNGLSVIAKNETGKMAVLSKAILQNVTITNYGIGVRDKHGLFISSDAHGSLGINKSNISDIKNDSEDFSIVQ